MLEEFPERRNIVDIIYTRQFGKSNQAEQEKRGIVDYIQRVTNSSGILLTCNYKSVSTLK